MLLTGWVAMGRMGVDLFPDVNIPVVSVATIYPGAGPEEIEELISKPLEEELSSISGLKKISSRNQEGVSVVFGEFTLDTDIKYAEQQFRDKVGLVKPKLPTGIKEPKVVRFDPADQPIVRLALFADLDQAKLYDLAKETVKARLEQVQGVGSVKLIGGTRREIQIELDRNKLISYQMPTVVIANRLKTAGLNVPVGKFESGSKETSYRTLGRYESLSQIENTIVSFSGEVGNAVLIKQLGTVRDGTEDEETIGYLWASQGEGVEEKVSFLTKIGNFFKGKKENSATAIKETKPALFIDVYKQSGANTVSVADEVLKRIGKLNEGIQNLEGKPKIRLIRDGSKWIRYNVEDVTEAIVIGILLAVITVYFFLGNFRSTVITGLALPNSMLGAFVLMWTMGFTINVMTLLALSLAVGLLVDDAIVVRENIFRKLEEGKGVMEAAETGTTEVTLAVIGTSLTVIAVFLPVGFLSGIVGQFFKQFGLTVVFAMLISLFDGLAVAPMLSAYFAGKIDHNAKPNKAVELFDKFQTWLERQYGKVMKVALKRPGIVLLLSLGIFILSILSLKLVKSTFLPANDQGEFLVTLDLPPGTSLNGTKQVADQVLEVLKKIPEMEMIAVTIGKPDGGEPNAGTLAITLVDSKKRKLTTTQVKDQIRELLKPFEYARPAVSDYSAVGGGIQYPFQLVIKGENLGEMEAYSKKVLTKLKSLSDLADLDTDYRAGKPEYQIHLDNMKMQLVGVLPGVAGSELRYQIAGDEVSKFYDRGIEYVVKMRLRPDQRNLRMAYDQTKVPNIANKLIPLSAISVGKETAGPSRINRIDRARTIVINANLAPGGAVQDATRIADEILRKELPPPPGIRYNFQGQSEDFKELLANIVLAFGLALVFIYLVLASLYESFITPVTILFAIPPAISGAFFALALTREMLNLFSMIGLILLMGLVAKNSILLVDYAMQAIREKGMSRNDAIYEAGLVRLRPILMTSLAMIMGTVPIALGFGEAAKSRTAMGIAIIGGLILSTVVTLVVVPSIFGFIDRFREWIESKFRPEYDMNASMVQHAPSTNKQKFYEKEWASMQEEVEVELPKKSKK
ncbi:efflux RND transporter permease subunit [Leptospira interrogans]|uniref:RND transporter, Hydrophobe/Amphiphile Efflux-1 (HAE1)/Heavy Metal Efflux (HME) family, permease protein n=6 Tax=Leptospira interrogans TaxID=173 RepID=A0A0E2D6F1_LEPIR|nr:efflux RND transporter permease subunit [Leptospira interrogans]EMF42215.1 RND transporter, hydrophobe/amphiphile efflux-1/heavy metal efflux family, permease protein [Leptospira interrogans serovar Lora str. TE 1992]EMF74409.1 RND transporter, Hydrophobe/Amphiphile Efflux-1 (HAE1)/Heavy Metal Efflux (HME) family, permease protein [Leptospira interrogans serovar Canicola str. LT1962]ALE41027.1 cation/multidrug efflux pump [Leptospira interrogans serovar Hardjo str. Norma]EKO24571.1 RND trans